MAQLHGIASLDRGFRTRSNHITGSNSLWRDDVATFTVGSTAPEPMRTAIRIVFETLNLAFDAILSRRKSTMRYFCL
jgi:hypothetical protein